MSGPQCLCSLDHGRLDCFSAGGGLMPCCWSAGALMVMDKKITTQNDSCDTLFNAIIGPSWWWTDHSLPRFTKFASVAPHCKQLQKSGRRGKLLRKICLANLNHNWCPFWVFGHFEPVSHLLTSRCASWSNEPHPIIHLYYYITCETQPLLCLSRGNLRNFQILYQQSHSVPLSKRGYGEDGLCGFT